MANKLTQLYDALKADGVGVPDTYDDFKQYVTSSTKNRQQLYDALKADGVGVPDTYDDFAHEIFGKPTSIKQVGNAKLPDVKDVMKPTSIKQVGNVKLPDVKDVMKPLKQQKVNPYPMFEAEQFMDEHGRTVTTPKYAPGFDKDGHIAGEGVFKDIISGRSYDPNNVDESDIIERGVVNATNIVNPNIKNQTRNQVAMLSDVVKDEMIKRGDELDVERRAEEKGGILGKWRDFPRGGGGGAHTFNSSTANGKLADADYLNLSAAQNSLTDAQRIIDEANHNSQSGTFGKWLESSFAGGVARGLGEKLFDARTWDMGITEVGNNASLLAALDAADKGKPLTRSQELMLDAKAVELATNAYFGSSIGRGYKAGAMTMESIAMIAEMTLNPASTVGSTAVNKLSRYALRRFGTKALESNAKKYAAAKIGARVTGDIIGAGLMTASTGSIRTAAGAVERIAGDVKFYTNEVGESTYAGHEAGEDVVSAIGNSFGSNTIEDYSEMVGAYFAPMLGSAGKLIEKGANKIGLGKVTKFIDDVASSDVAKLVSDFEQHAKWNGTIGEYTEEVAGGIMNALVVGDQTLDTDKDTGVFNLDKNIDTLLGVSLMGGFISATKTIGYRTPKYQAKKDMINKDNIGAAVFGNQDTWGDIRNTIAFGNENDIESKLNDVLSNPDYNEKQKYAALEYAKSTVNYKGMIKGEEKRRMDENTDPIQVDTETSFDNGYTLESQQEMNDAKNMRDLKELQFKEAFGYGEDNDVSSFDIEAFKRMEADGLFDTEEKRQTALDYLNSKATYEGMIHRVRDDIDNKISASDATIDGNTNREDSMIHPATMKLNDRKVYIVGGNVVMNEDGSAVDTAKSDESIIIRDAETGEIEFTDPHSILSVDGAIDPITEKETVQQKIRDEHEQKAVNDIDGILAFNVADVYNIPDDKGAQHTYQIAGDNGDGTVDVVVDGNVEEPIMLQKEQLQQMFTAYNLARLNQHEQAKAEEKKQIQQEAEANRPFMPEDEVITTDENGNIIHGVVYEPLNEDNQVGVTWDSPINGKWAGAFDVNTLERYNKESVPETTESVPEIAESVPEIAESVQNEQQQVSAYERIPKDEKGNPIYEQAETPDIAWDAIVEQAEGDVDMAQTVADGMVADKGAALKKIEKVKSKGGETIAEKIAAEKERKAAIEEAKAQLEIWDKIAMTQNRRKAAEQAERSRIAAEQAAKLKAEQEKLRAEKEEAERIEREALNGIPDIVDDTPQDARARGFRRENGHKVDRQQPLTPLQGKEVSVKFGNDAIPNGRVAVIEARELQPSHLQGVRNPAHFIDEAQPKERNDQASVASARKIASDIRPEEITTSVTAYTGAPTVNSRGEVIQGNSRSDALREMWNTQNEQAAKYKQYLKEHADEFGLNADDIERMERPVLVNMLDVADDEAIKLGQYVAQDTESGGTERIKPKNVIQKMGADMRSYANLLLKSADEDTSFAGLVDSNGGEVLKWMNGRGYITPTQYRSAFDSKGNITAEAKNDLKGILYQSLFKGGSTRLEEMFNAMPAKAQRAILATAYRDYDSPNAERMAGEIQNSIRAYSALSADEQFASAKTFKDARQAVEWWKRQYQMDDVSGESYLPAENFSNFALHLATMYKGESQSFIQSTFNHLYDLIQGTQEENLFEKPDNTPRSLAQAIYETLKIEYNGQQRSNVLVGDTSTSQRGKQGGNGGVATGERVEGGNESADNPRGTESGSGQNKGTGEAFTRRNKAEDIQPELNEEDASIMLANMKRMAEAVPQLELTPESWMQTFGLSNKVETPIGSVKMGENQYIKLVGKKRSKEFGMVVSTIQNPDVVFIEPSKAKDKQKAEREYSYVFLKTFVKDGNTIRYYASVTVSIDGMEISVSSHYMNEKPVMSRLREFQRIYTKTALLSNSSEWHLAEQQNAEPDLLPTQENDAIYIADKDTQSYLNNNELGEKIAKAEAETNTTPTVAQKEAGNYKKGHVQVGTFDITIENPKGSERKGTDANGKEWSITMQNTYGYIRGTEGVDGDHIDVFLSNDIDGWNGRKVFVIDQTNTDGTFDEHKVMLGFNEIEEAESAYFANYSPDWKEKHSQNKITAVNLEDFEKWINSSHRKTKAFAEYSSVKKEKANQEEQSPRDKAALDALTDKLAEAIGEDNVITDHEEGQRVLDMANGKDVKNQLGGNNISFSERQRRAVESKGTVMPGLVNMDVEIVKGEKEHGFSNFKEAKDWAKENIVKTFSDEETGGKGKISISNRVVNKFLSESAVDKSEDKDIHQAVLKVLPNVIKASIEAEEHPDYKKGSDDKRGEGNGTNTDVLVHRLYGAVDIDGKTYRVKVTMYEFKDDNAANKPHSYEATKIELLDGTLANDSKRSTYPRPNNSIKATNLLKGVEKSYDKGVKLLDESEKVKEQRVELSQKFGSGKTSLNQVASGFRNNNAEWIRGTRNVDVGGGRFNTATDFLKERGVDNYVLDPVNRTEEENIKAISVSKEGADTATCHNVLNVVDNADMRSNIILEVAKSIKSAGTAYFSVYEGNGSGKGKQSQSDSWQENRKTEDYVSEIKQHFGNVVRKGKLIIAKEPITDGKEASFFYNSKWEDPIQFFKGKDGKVLGFTTKGKVYIDPRVATAETPIHEYTHLWSEMIRRVNPKAWEDIVKLMQGETALWEKVAAKYPELKGDALVEEVLSHYSGKRGAERIKAEIDAIANGKGTVIEKAEAIGALARLKVLLNKFWEAVSDLLHIRFTKAEDVADRVLADLLNGVNPNEVVNKAAEKKAEKDSIVEKAKADGSYMKAPNGKATKLNEKQWVEVRTKAFKDWFGDWEKAARIEKLRNSETVVITGKEYEGKYELNRDSAKEYIKSELRGSYLIDDTNETVIISKVGANKVTSHSMGSEAHIKSIIAIPQLLKNAIFIEERQNEKGNDKFDSYRYYVCGVNIEGNDYTAKITIGVKQGEKYYDHALTEIEKGKLLDQIKGQAVVSERSFKTTGNASEPSSEPYVVKDTKLLSILQTNHSKVLDENGEPLVVYHGTDSPFTKFDLSKIRDREGSFFFTESEEEAQSYSSSGYYIPVFVDIRNPFDYEKGTVPENYQEQWKNIANKREQVAILKELGYDGFTADFENGNGWGEVSTFSPNQIKSATENNGDYSKGNDDIRYSKGDVDGEDYRDLSESERYRAVVEYYNELDNGVAGTADSFIIKSSKTAYAQSIARGLSEEDAEKIAELSKDERNGAIFCDGTNEIFIFAEHCDSRNDLRDTFYHENLHYFFRTKLKDKYAEIVDTLYNDFNSIRPEIVDAIRNDYSETGYSEELMKEEVVVHFMTKILNRKIPKTVKRLSDKSKDYIELIFNQYGEESGSGFGRLHSGRMDEIFQKMYNNENSTKREAISRGETETGNRTADTGVDTEQGGIGEKDSFNRDGEGSYSDDSLSYENDSIAKVLGKSKRSAAQRKAFAERERKRMADHVNELAAKLHLDNVEIITDTNTLEGKKSRAKGFYSKSSGKITIVIPNHSSAFDVEKTLLHEAVAHYGLRQLFGEHFDTFLDNVFRNADEPIRKRIVELSAKNGWDFRKATEEYLAGLAENTDFENINASWWSRIKKMFFNMLKSIGFKGFNGVTLTDNELRYILWRSYQKLRNKGIFGEAEDIVMREQLSVADSGRKEDVMYRDGDPEVHERALARDRYEQRVRSGMYQLQEALQDSMLGLKEAMNAILGKNGKRIEDIDSFENAYLGENRLSSVNKAEADAFAHTLFKLMLDEVAKLTHSESEREELTDYMMAKHGLERNRVMAERDAQKDYDANIKQHPKSTKTLQDFIDKYRERDYAGLTALTGMDEVADAEFEAQQMVDDYENNHDTDVLWDKVNAVNKATLSKSYECGMMNKETFDKVSDMYEYYIPLRGFDEKTSSEAYAYLNDKHSAFNAPIKKAVGRKSKADDPFANMQSMAESAITQGNRNKLVKQKFLNFALNHPSDLVSVSDLWLQYDSVADEWKPVFPDNIDINDTPEDVEQKMFDFEEKMKQLADADPDQYKHGKDAVDIPYRVVESRDERQHQVVVKRNGRDYVITINGNPRAAQALNGQTNPDNDTSGAIGAILRAGETVNRQLSAFYTTRNPDFIVSNFMHDMLYANTMAWIKESPNYALRFNRNFAKSNPVMMKRLLAKYRKGTLDMSNKTEAMFQQFMLNGGETGYANMRDIEQHKNDIKRELKKANGKLKVARAWSLLGERFDEYNRAIENCARFTAFVTSREMGRTIDRSIYDAKEISVNFNKKGSGAKFYDATGQTKAGDASALVSGLGRSGFVFWNAAIQGTTNFGRQFKQHPAKAFTGAAVMFLLGAVIASLGGSGDDDDDDKNAYYNLPEYVRRSNILFRIGDTWISIPLPVEYRALYGMGELMTSTFNGKEHQTGGEIASDIAGQVSQILPIDFLEGGGGWKSFVPSYAKPLVEAYISEKSWTGMPLYKDTPFNKDMPEWTKAYKSANKYIVGLSNVLNEATGGDAYTKGGIDINPAKVEYMLNGYFGGVSQSIDKLTKTAETIFGDREYDPRSILLVNRLAKAGDERTEYRAVNNEYFRLKEEHDRIKTRLKHYEDDTDNGVFDYAEKIDFLYNSPEYERYEIFEDYRKDIDALYEEMKEPMSDEDRKVIDMELNELKKEMIDEMNKTRKRK